MKKKKKEYKDIDLIPTLIYRPRKGLYYVYYIVCSASHEISITSDMQKTPPYGRKWRRNKEPLDENKREEWKGRLKAQHSEN